MSRYEVVVGNIGTTHAGESKSIAEAVFKHYVRQSKSESEIRAKGEQVTLFEDGEPIEEHQGYQHMYENHSEDELQHLVATRRSEDNTHCPVCPSGAIVGATDDVGIVEYPDGDYRLHVRMRCAECGFRWSDVCRVVGAQL